jgi:hypothetical protein
MLSRHLRFSVGVLALAALFASVGCGSSSSGTAQIRVLQASPSQSSVNVLIDGTTTSSALGYTSSTTYQTVHSGSRHLQVEPAGTSTFILDKTLSLASSSETTVVVTGLSPNFSSLVLTDNNTAPTSGTAMVRFVNAAPSMGTADVYIVQTGTALTPGSPTVEAVGFGQASSYQTVTLPTTGTSGTNYTVFFTQPGTTLAFLDTGPINLASGQNRTIVALNNLYGGFTFVTLADLN